jgi:hypothetical protein
VIAMASAHHCERCKCKTLHIPLPNGELACEYHLPEPERGARVTPSAPAAEPRERLATRGYVDFSALFWLGLVAGLLLGACGYCLASQASRHVEVEIK